MFSKNKSNSMLFGSDDPVFSVIESSARRLACVATASLSTVTEKLTVKQRHEILKFNCVIHFQP